MNLPNIDYITIINHLGTFAFAVSGLRLAASKNFDWFGAYVIGFVTAIGGGTVRDLFLGVTPFWMTTPSYATVTGISLLIFLFFSKSLTKLQKTIFLFDAIGLGLFVVVGLEKTLGAGFPFWVAIIMGTITGSFGGMIRDVLINETPLIFRKDIYASACIVGGLAYWLCVHLQLPTAIAGTVAAITVIVIRLVAVKFHIQMPTLQSQQSE